MRIEKDVKRKIKSVLDKHGWFWFTPPTGGGFGTSGVSDVLAIRAGVFMAIEAKFGDNTPSALQKGFLNSVNAESGFGFVVNEKNMDQFEAFMENFDKAALAQRQGKEVRPEDGSIMLNAIAAMTHFLADK